MHLLLIEDDLDLGTSLQQALRGEGHTSERLRSARQGQVIGREKGFDCVLLDLSLPDGNGMDLLRQWRSEGLKLPVIIITASAGLGERLAGLDGGADDFILKPFVVAELLSRLGAVTRRSAQQASALWTVGDLEIDTAAHEVRQGGEAVHLAPREYDLLVALARNPGRAVPKHRLTEMLSPLGETMDVNAVEVHVHNLRRKLGADCLRTVRGVGYLIRP